MQALNDGVTPLIFATYREISATFLLFCMSLVVYKTQQPPAAGKEADTESLVGGEDKAHAQHWVPQRAHYWRFAVMGVCSFGNVVRLLLPDPSSLPIHELSLLQVGFIVGLSLTSAPNASGSHPSLSESSHWAGPESCCVALCSAAADDPCDRGAAVGGVPAGATHSVEGPRRGRRRNRRCAWWAISP